MTNPTTTQDAAGRSIAVGDTVGGTTSGRFQATIVGPVVSIGKISVIVQVTNGSLPGSSRPRDGDKVRISTDRVFLITRAAGTPDTRAERATGKRQGLPGRISDMADCWEKELPEAIRTPWVVSCLRSAVEAFQ